MLNNRGEINPTKNQDFSDYENVNVSWADTVSNTHFKNNTLAKTLEIIGTSAELKNKIAGVRQIKDDKLRREKKQETLPYFVIGQFKNNTRKNANLISTQHMIFDYDHIGEKLNDRRKKLIDDSRVNFLFTSPSGDGLKVGYKLDKPITEYETFSALYKYYANKLGVELGEKADKTSAASNPCYFSYDPDLYSNPNSKCLTIAIPKEELKKFKSKKIDWDEVKIALNGLVVLTEPQWQEQ